MIVVDASVTVTACLSREGFAPLAGERLVAPALLWSEVRSTLHELLWRSAIGADDALAARHALGAASIERRMPRRLGAEAWRIADELGWAKTYDAEYVALASLVRCRLVTLDERLRRGADRLGFVIAPGEL